MFKRAHILAPALMGLALVGGAASAQNTGQSPGAKADASNSSPTLLLQASQPDPLLNNGCWVQLMDNIEKPKSREYLTIVGSMYMPKLQTPSGKNWSGRADGISIGPNALVRAYGEEQYGGRAAIIQPNSIVQDLRADLGFVNSIESMKIDCRNS